jgi:uncharacterized membrane protein YeaQ/YmgE (transglycosylase-associated protein family)
MKRSMAAVLATLVAAPALAQSRLSLPAGARGESVPLEAALAADAIPGPAWGVAPRASHAKEGALVGAVALGVAGAVVATQICRIAEEDQDCSQDMRVAAYTLISAAIGAGVGALIGSAF